MMWMFLIQSAEGLNRKAWRISPWNTFGFEQQQKLFLKNESAHSVGSFSLKDSDKCRAWSPRSGFYHDVLLLTFVSWTVRLNDPYINWKIYLGKKQSPRGSSLWISSFAWVLVIIPPCHASSLIPRGGSILFSPTFLVVLCGIVGLTYPVYHYQNWVSWDKCWSAVLEQNPCRKSEEDSVSL